MTFFVIAKDQQVIYVHHSELIKTIMEDIIHQRLKDCRRISQAHRHRQILEFPIFVVERSLLNIFWLHPYLMKTSFENTIGLPSRSNISSLPSNGVLFIFVIRFNALKSTNPLSILFIFFTMKSSAPYGNLLGRFHFIRANQLSTEDCKSLGSLAKDMPESYLEQMSSVST